MIGMDSTGGHIEKLGSGEGGEACQMTHMLNSWKTKQYLEKEKKNKKNQTSGLDELSRIQMDNELNHHLGQ